MLYFGTPSSPAIREAMNAGVFGCMTTPAQGNRIPRDAIWAADNGRFGKGWPGETRYLRWAARLEPIADRCAFALAPDVPFDMAATLEFSAPYAARLRELGLPVALALQNGAEDMDLPWDDYDAVFVAGDTAWKRGIAAAALVGEALRRGKYAHWGRANSIRAVRQAASIGCSSADGTTFAYGPDTNSEDMQRWISQMRRSGVQMALC